MPAWGTCLFYLFIIPFPGSSWTASPSKGIFTLEISVFGSTLDFGSLHMRACPIRDRIFFPTDYMVATKTNSRAPPQRCSNYETKLVVRAEVFGKKTHLFKPQLQYNPENLGSLARKRWNLFGVIRHSSGPTLGRSLQRRGAPCFQSSRTSPASGVN